MLLPGNDLLSVFFFLKRAREKSGFLCKFNSMDKERKERKGKRKRARRERGRGRGGKGRGNHTGHTDLQKEFIQPVDHVCKLIFRCY